MHFFNPAPVQPLVEVIGTVLTALPRSSSGPATSCEGLGKTTIACRDRAGFVVNALLVPYLNHAAAWYARGFATREEIDAAMVGAGLPMGPLALLDLVGHDVTVAVLHRLHAADRATAGTCPTPLLTSLVEAGLLGRKSGRGFYTYDADGATDAPGRSRRRPPRGPASCPRRCWCPTSTTP